MQHFNKKLPLNQAFWWRCESRNKSKFAQMSTPFCYILLFLVTSFMCNSKCKNKLSDFCFMIYCNGLFVFFSTSTLSLFLINLGWIFLFSLLKENVYVYIHSMCIYTEVHRGSHLNTRSLGKYISVEIPYPKDHFVSRSNVHYLGKRYCLYPSLGNCAFIATGRTTYFEFMLCSCYFQSAHFKSVHSVIAIMYSAELLVILITSSQPSVWWQYCLKGLFLYQVAFTALSAHLFTSSCF